MKWKKPWNLEKNKVVQKSEEIKLFSTEFKDIEFQKKAKINFKNDAIKMASLTIIFFCFSFIMLTFFQNSFDFSLRIFSIRIWQYLLAIFSGGALGVAGYLLQKLTKNNLADVSILGIGSLNIIFISLYIFSTYKNVSSQEVIRQFLPIIAIASSIFGTSIIYFLAKLGGSSSDRFIIIGIALQFLFEAISIAMVNPVASGAPGSTINFVISEIQNFTLGRFPDVQRLGALTSWRISTIVSAVSISFFVFIIWILRRQIDVIEANEKLAIAYGIRVEWLKAFLYLCVAILAGIEAAMVGTIALLGILAPNIAKLIFGNKSRTNVFASFIIGALLVLIASFISINLSADIPIGFLSTAIIIPYFIYIILRKRK